MPTLSYSTAIQHLINGRSAREGIQLASQLIFFSLLWVLLSSGIAYLGRDNFSIDAPISWLMIIIPTLGVVLFTMGLQCRHYWKGMGRASLYLAKASFKCNDNIRGYAEFKDLKWQGNTHAVAHISLKKKQASGDYKEEWITKADTQTAPGNKGIRVSFSSMVRPTLDEEPSPNNYTWCLHISLQHSDECYKEEFAIPMSESLDTK